MTQPLGRRPCGFPGKKDWHLHYNHRKIGNWWEDEMSTGDNKAASNRDAKKEITEALLEKP